MQFKIIESHLEKALNVGSLGKKDLILSTIFGTDVGRKVQIYGAHAHFKLNYADLAA